jgi:hypothetical protein
MKKKVVIANVVKQSPTGQPGIAPLCLQALAALARNDKTGFI